MARRTRFVGFDTGEVATPASVDVGQRRGRRHGHGLGLRPSRYVGKHRVLEESNGHKPARAERRTDRRKVRKTNDFGFGT
jgi:hypothetical protein